MAERMPASTERAPSARLALGWLCLAAGVALAAALHPAVARAQAAQALSGPLVSVGSNTLGGVLARWGEEFEKRHPGVEFRSESRGSATAPAALIGGESSLAPMSRKLTEEEEDAYEEALGTRPVHLRVGLDAMAVYVHRDNPLRGISIPQLDGIFSRTRECGGEAIGHWGSLLFGSLAERPIVAFGRNDLSGTQVHFREQALCGGEFNRRVEELADSASVVAAVGGSVNAIGYAGIGFRNAQVRALGIARNDDQHSPYYSYYVPRNRDHPDPQRRYAYVIDGRYPLSRDLYVYVRKRPGEALPPLVEAFLEFALAEDGQRILQDEGFIPLPRKSIARQLRKLEPSYERRWWQRD